MICSGQNLIENNTGATPIFLGGNSKLSYYFVKYLRYPAPARRMGTEGIVIVSATVTKDGKMIDEKVELGLENGLSEEALRLLQMLPDDWIPLKINGEPVETRVFIPVKFKLA